MSEHLISALMLEQNKLLHASGEGFGGSGWKHAQPIVDFAAEIGAKTILDYGCGEGTLRRMLTHGISKDHPRVEYRGKVFEYDPAIKKKSKAVMADLIVCTDVMEHVEPDKLRNVLAHIRSLSRKGIYFVIATRESNKLLPNGQNAHLIVQPADWWLTVLRKNKLRVRHSAVHEMKESGGEHSLVALVKS